jgi:FlaG/FlaF family flagellin (archaellin)
MTENGGTEYFIRVKDNNANGYQASKILTFHNFVNAFSTEYGSMVSNASLGTFYVTTNTSHVILWMVPNSTNTSLNISRVNL